MNNFATKTINVLWLVAAMLPIPSVSFAHSPHHVITDVASAPVQDSGSHTFILIMDQVFRSDEQGAYWKNLTNGLSIRYSFTSIAVSPQYASDSTLFLASSGDGVYRSGNSGETWEKVIVGLERLDIARLSVSGNFSSDGRLLAAATAGGVWRSIDGGNSWQMVLTEDVTITSISEVAWLPGHAIVIAGDSEGRVWRSEDNGRLWEIIHELPDAGAVTGVSGLADHVYAGTASGALYHSSDAGRAFVKVQLPDEPGFTVCEEVDPEASVSDPTITSVAVVPAEDGEATIFVTSRYGGVYVSRDNARSWSGWSGGLTCDSQADRQSVPHFRDLDVTRLDDGRIIYWLAAFDGLFRNADLAAHWQQQETLPLGLIKGLAVPGGANQSLEIALATYGGGFYLTDDRGSTWTIGNKGLMTTRLTGMAFSPNYSENDVIYAGAIRRLLISSDRGHSWQRIRLDKPSFGTRVRNKLTSWGVPTAWLESSDKSPSAPIYPTHIAPLSGERASQVLIGTRYHGVMAFDESSSNVESLWEGTDQVINSLVMSPDFDRDQTLFASIRGQGVFRSADGGAGWTAVNVGLDFTGDWAGNPGRGDYRRDVSLSISPDFFADHALFAGSPAGNGLYVSIDRGESWARSVADFGAVPAPVLAIGVSPEFRSDNSMLISIRGRGIFRSRDRGKSFEPIGAELVEANASIEYLEYSPDYANDRSIVAASDEKLFLSIDRGDSWTEVTRPVRYEDMRDVVHFEGNWEQQEDEQYSALTETASTEQGSGTSMRFVGNGIRWLGSKGPGYGSAQVFVDGELVETVSCRSDKLRHMQEIITVQGLGSGPHQIEVRVHAPAPGQKAGIVGIDAFDVLP